MTLSNIFPIISSRKIRQHEAVSPGGLLSLRNEINFCFCTGQGVFVFIGTPRNCQRKSRAYCSLPALLQMLSKTVPLLSLILPHICRSSFPVIGDIILSLNWTTALGYFRSEETGENRHYRVFLRARSAAWPVWPVTQTPSPCCRYDSRAPFFRSSPILVVIAWSQYTRVVRPQGFHSS